MMNISNIPPRVSRAEASAYLLAKHGISRTPGTLAKLAVIGGGPAFRKAGIRRVLYDVAELDRWAERIISQPMASTSAAA
ncbi:hypothetical protein [Mesorhizobium sp. M4B.F.Ca.ET.013.02.1.1]|uniref:helix-turn-helix transcriptional regulator n=1 Tax=Mesorhizobium sp. M4B.F.Ca.ET.013.02.1.1 TaxID=2496755 RepID=UPI001FDF7728|nr:hypothetical protein [Mesorhizobium sp. M4B.F.Ca.ET.013.02.1.1]